MEQDIETSRDISQLFNKDELLNSLQDILKVLLNGNSNSYELRDASNKLFDLFSGITNIKVDSLERLETDPIYLECGKAIAPLYAAMCIREHIRTAKFLRGIYAGIKEVQQRFPGETIHILYAGCGPCAPFAVLMAALFTSDQVQFTLLDISEYSLKNAKTIIDILGFQNSIREYISCDASLYNHPEEIDIHMVITETMLNALQKEPQVSITGNLVPQLKKNGILIPQKITVSACLANVNKEHYAIPAESENKEFTPPEGYRLRINPVTIFELSAEKPHTIKQPIDKDGILLEPGVTVPIEVPEEGKHALMLNTSITVFGEHTLEEYDTSITMPLVLKESLLPGMHKCYEFNYYIGKQPGFKYREV